MLDKYEIEIPNQFVRALGIHDKDVSRTIRKEIAVHFFKENMLSFGLARQLSGLSVRDFMELLRERKVSMHYSEVDYNQDCETIQEFL